MFGFPISRDMDPKDLYELLNKTVAGETRQQLERIMREPTASDMSYGTFMSDVYQQMQPVKLAEKNAELQDWLKSHPLFKVIDADTDHNIAFISRLNMQRDTFGDFSLRHDYYMVGVSDELHLYMHPVNGYVPPLNRDTLHASNKMHSIRHIYDWMNRADLGFSHSDRVQGDILMKAAPMPIHDNRGKRTIKILGHHCFNIEGTNGSPVLVDEQNSRNEILNTNRRTVENGHRLKTDGDVFEFQLRDDAVSMPDERLTNYHIILGASAVMLEHVEHKTYSMHIPQQYMVNVVRQRGEPLVATRSRVSTD